MEYVFLVVNFLNSAIILLFLTMSLYKKEKFKGKIAYVFSLILANRIIKDWLIMLMELILSASAGIITIVLLFAGLALASDFGVLLSTQVSEFIKYDSSVIIFITLYAIIIATISWLVKRFIRG